MTTRELLIEPIAYLAPAKTLDGLTAEQADRRVQGANHSMAEILAHMTFWQEWFVKRCAGDAEPMVSSAAHGWPATPPGSWPSLTARFFTSLDRAARFEDEGRLDQKVTPAIEFPLIAHFTIRDVILHMSAHNAHHLGQIITMRQILGLWPPPAGSWTW